MEWYLVVLICTALKNNDFEHHFMYLFAIRVSFLVKGLLKSFGPFYNWAVYLLLISER